MLLAIDIGNTDFTIGIFQEKKLCDTFRMRTKINRTSDEYGVFILNTLQYKGYEAKMWKMSLSPLLYRQLCILLTVRSSNILVSSRLS